MDEKTEEGERTHISDSRGTPAAALCEPLDAQAGDLGMRAAFLPGIDAAGAEGGALVRVEAAGDDGEDV